MAVNLGRLALQVLGTAAGLLFIVAAVKAIRAGDFKGPLGIRYGTPYGVAHLWRAERPLAFWACVVAYLAFGVAILWCVWLVV